LAKVELYYLLISSVGIDLLIGDPRFLLHPVQIIGFFIKKLTDFFINYAKRSKFLLYVGGFLIAFLSISISYTIGKIIEISYFKYSQNILFGLVIVLGLSSCIASKSLISSSKSISNLFKDKFINPKKKLIISQKVQQIVSRNVTNSSLDELLRSTIESLTENSVDGIFAPIFWIFTGLIFIQYSINLPGPLSLGFAYKAISTLDSMIGYKYGDLKYLGFFSAKIEDYATYIPCRLVVITLPLVNKSLENYFFLLSKVFHEGGKYKSPNAGLSEGIFAHILNIQLGGENLYSEGKIVKPLLNPGGNKYSYISVDIICNLIIKLLILWIFIFSSIFFIT